LTNLESLGFGGGKKRLQLPPATAIAAERSLWVRGADGRMLPDLQGYSNLSVAGAYLRKIGDSLGSTDILTLFQHLVAETSMNNSYWSPCWVKVVMPAV